MLRAAKRDSGSTSRRITLACLASALLGTHAAAHELGSADARALFLQHCATCHGETGDGNGTQKLDKPARSFLAGGFSYGNTTEALVRTITFGIPSTPMPSFESALNAEQRAALAAYVRALGPAESDVSAAETRLVVRDVPLFARGKLAPLVDGAPEIVRGLLCGTPDGSTFEWRVDDVRLLGVRRGEFVERRDWSGRGGDALAPLGRVVHVCGAGRPGPAFARRSASESGARETPLVAHLRSTYVEGGAAHVVCRLVESSADGAANVLAFVDETDRGANAGALAGFARRVTITPSPGVEGVVGGVLVWTVAEDTSASVVERGERWVLRRATGGAFELTWLRAAPPDVALEIDAARVRVAGPSSALARGPIEVVTLLPAAWDDSVRAAWRAELAR